MDGSFAQAPLSSKLWAETPKSRKIAEEIKRIRALLNIIIVWLHHHCLAPATGCTFRDASLRI
jgi:hypothetical protein